MRKAQHTLIIKSSDLLKLRTKLIKHENNEFEELINEIDKIIIEALENKEKGE